MSSLMGRLLSTNLLTFYCFTFICVDGRNQDLRPSCEVELMVRRGTTWKAAPKHRVSIKCPVRLCGESLNVSWCKLLDSHNCEAIYDTESVQLNVRHVKDELISFLTFKRISIHDDGLYRCYLQGFKVELIGHMINVSVSDSYQGVKISDDIKEKSPSLADDEYPSWMPYFYICLGIALLIAMLTVLTLLSFHGQKQIMPHIHKNGEEMFNHTIPALPRHSSPSSLFLQTHPPFQNDIHPPGPAERSPSHPLPLTPSGNLSAVANRADRSHVADHAVYATINHQRAGLPAGKQHTGTTQGKKAEYAAISVS